jgi:hypothetical protein
MPGSLLPPRQAAAGDERGLELLAYATRVDDARLLVIVRHGRVVHWRHLPYKKRKALPR